uniref:Uncharacterized protein n=1 Tax=Aegilops tauschii subsp. strangulata TaxID=200361 RepID=A0A453QAD7_AEGTS
QAGSSVNKSPQKKKGDWEASVFLLYLLSFKQRKKTQKTSTYFTIFARNGKAA